MNAYPEDSVVIGKGDLTFLCPLSWAVNAYVGGTSEAKTRAADAAIRTLTKAGQPITFQAVQRQAGVSHSFLYAHTALRERIERLRRQNKPAARPQPDQDSQNNLVLALTAEVTRLKKQLRQQTQALRDALAQAHGENLELRRELARRGWSTKPHPTRADHVASIAGTR